MNIKRILILIAFVGLSVSVFAAPHHAKSVHRARDVHAQQVVDKVNINSAEVSALQAVKGIGPKKAEAIVAYRQSHGPFNSINDLTKVKGIGEKRLSKISQYLTV